MADKEREEIRKALLWYCELDTLAMVIVLSIWWIWLNMMLRLKARSNIFNKTFL
ncbi:hypothetical protein LB450_12015 [Psychroflexus sp. CAK1W]|uniref:hypothetical protein n=1 Tax=Psychroflexus curvus TaxID=2873595 RepID=UPI001CCD5FFB|nr:hypothetical protein [Psychroflexus curvus]MBZ9628830.1 hypothetical protein [Psychroflexus curvus]